ncbi:hypothetical protein AVEN_70810-1 [Araneus ventricosus]|uniref:Uncharacterized protein n=1 Tax=Araneus ventricosus TaxID=182803 RepID=A0A4Y2V9T1_ARAVE|nr:hypothetical protein AVEN_171205-1 [Araneus ventricosus]GBO21308.1 hypothetical protein AVEN_70810-1 [Araneus ventricosus]
MVARKCMMRKEAGDLLSILQTWRRKLMEKFERADALRFHLYLISFSKFQEVFFMELCQNTKIIASCAHAGQVVDFYDYGIQKLVVLYDKCLNIGRNYAEKYIKVQALT